MVDFRDVTRDDVLAAMAEYDGMGADDFLALHGFGRAREYVLWFDGRSYDSKAILGVAYRRATGRALSSDDFSGGKQGAARVLRDLGFDVTSPEAPADASDCPGTGISTRSWTRKNSHDTRIVATCPSCHMALPATNLCDRCD